MMLICAAVYDTLLRHVSKFIKEEILGEQSTSNQISHQDSDDVLSVEVYPAGGQSRSRF